MAENPTKHSEIIEPGNPFEPMIKGLEKALKLVKQMRKEVKATATERVKSLEKITTVTKENKKLIEETAKETKKLTEKDKELLRIEKAIEKEKAKLAVANSKEAKQLAELKERNRAANAEMRKTIKQQQTGVKTTNTWGKALGSFAAKFNTIGNVAAMAIGKITQGLKRAITQFISFDKIIRSTQTTSDRMDRVMGRLEGSFNALNRALALGDLSNIGKIMREAADAAEDYVLALDALGDTQRALDIQNARSRREVKQLQEIYNDTSQSVENRLTAAIKAQGILNELQEQQQRITDLSVDAEIKKVKSTFGLNREQISLFKRFIENYGLLTDSQVTALEKLEAKQVETTEGGGRLYRFFAKSVEGASVSQIQAIGDAEQAMADYDLMAKELSETLGFDVIPIMNTIVQINDDWRNQIGNMIIEQENQIGATQRLKSANAAMIGTIKRTAEAEANRKTVTEETTGAVEEGAVAIDDMGKKMDDLVRKAIGAGNAVRENIIKPLKIAKIATKEDADETEDAEDVKQNAALETFSILSDASLNFAEDNKALTISAAIVDGIAAVVATWKNSGGFPIGLAAAAAQAAIIAKLISNMRSQKFESGGSGLLGDTGGILTGKLHSQGGVNLGEIGEAERGEYFGIINRGMTNKYGNELPGIFDSLNNGSFHEVWGRNMVSKPTVVTNPDPWTRKMYEIMANTPQIYTDSNGKIVKHYPGRTHING